MEGGGLGEWLGNGLVLIIALTAITCGLVIPFLIWRHYKMQKDNKQVVVLFNSEDNMDCFSIHIKNKHLDVINMDKYKEKGYTVLVVDDCEPVTGDSEQ